MKKHRGLELISALLIIVGALASLWELLGMAAFHLGLFRFDERFDRGLPMLGFGLICLFLGFAGRVLTDIEINTRK